MCSAFRDQWSATEGRTVRLDRQLSRNLEAGEWNISADGHIKQAVAPIGEVEKPQQVHLRGTTGLPLASYSPVEAASSELRLTSAIQTQVLVLTHWQRSAPVSET
jgi:hypothetical protein